MTLQYQRQEDSDKKEKPLRTLKLPLYRFTVSSARLPLCQFPVLGFSLRIFFFCHIVADKSCAWVVF